MSAVQEPFFAAEGAPGRYRASISTRGPWSPDHQHAGPPAALLAREIERTAPAGLALTRLTVEILRPIPIAVLAVSARTLRAGRKAAWLEATLADDAGNAVAEARGVAIRTAELPLPVTGDPVDDPILPPLHAKPFEFGFFTGDRGYHTAIESRLARGEFGKGRVAMWMRMRAPLVAGEAPSPFQRVAIAADSGNGVSMALDPRKFSFVNPDLTIHLHRLPEGEWVCLDARTIPQARGIGLADTRLLDEQGPIGRSAQSLLIEPLAPR